MDTSGGGGGGGHDTDEQDGKNRANFPRHIINDDSGRNSDGGAGSTHHVPQWSAPVVLASGVENVWANPSFHRDRKKLHLVDTLWLGCGCHGMRAWLPLFPRNQEKLLSTRIMLPFNSNVYPLAVLFDEAIVLGASNDTILYQNLDVASNLDEPGEKSDGKPSLVTPPVLVTNSKRIPACLPAPTLSTEWPFAVVRRTCDIYLHQILRQL